jgi:hypothetical protein
MIKDDINHPPHYNQGKIEVFDYIKDCLTEEEFRGYIKGNIIKYISRERYKGKVEDLRKAEWYMKKYLQHHQESAHTVGPYGPRSTKPTDQSITGALTPYGREKIYEELNSGNTTNINEKTELEPEDAEHNQDTTITQQRYRTRSTMNANLEFLNTAG